MVTDPSRPSSNERQRVLKFNSPVKSPAKRPERSAKKDKSRDRMSQKKLRQFTTGAVDKSKSPIARSASKSKSPAKNKTVYQTQDNSKIPERTSNFLEATQRSIPNTTNKK